MAEVLTYNSLVTDIISYSEKAGADTAFIAQIPRFLMLAESRIAAELKTQGFNTVASNTFTGSTAVVAKPAYWRETISWNYTDPTTGRRTQVFPRTYEFIRSYWPLQSATGLPKYYADYDYNNFLVAPTPAGAYSFELSYFARITPLDITHQTNWLTDIAPQLLLSACMVEAQLWLKNWDKKREWEANYDRAMASLNREDIQRLAGDRTTNTTSGVR